MKGTHMEDAMALQAQAKFKRAQAALLTAQAEALEFQAENQFSDLGDEVKTRFEKGMQDSEEFMQSLSDRSKERTAEVLKNVEQQTEKLKSSLSEFRKNIETDN